MKYKEIIINGLASIESRFCMGSYKTPMTLIDGFEKLLGEKIFGSGMSIRVTRATANHGECMKPRAEKAYKNLGFLNSPDARTVRILAEYIEPWQRFQEEEVKNTIVFFGSERIRPRGEAQERLREAMHRTDSARRVSARQKRELRDAEVGVEMSRYYRDTHVRQVSYQGDSGERTWHADCCDDRTRRIRS